MLKIKTFNLDERDCHKVYKTIEVPAENVTNIEWRRGTTWFFVNDMKNAHRGWQTTEEDVDELMLRKKSAVDNINYKLIKLLAEHIKDNKIDTNEAAKVLKLNEKEKELLQSKL